MALTEGLVSTDIQLWRQDITSVIFTPGTSQPPGAKPALKPTPLPSVYLLPAVEAGSRAGLVSEDPSLESFSYLRLSPPKVTSSSLKMVNTYSQMHIFSLTFKLLLHHLHPPPLSYLFWIPNRHPS